MHLRLTNNAAGICLACWCWFHCCHRGASCALPCAVCNTEHVWGLPGHCRYLVAVRLMVHTCLVCGCCVGSARALACVSTIALSHGSVLPVGLQGDRLWSLILSCCVKLSSCKRSLED